MGYSVNIVNTKQQKEDEFKKKMNETPEQKQYQCHYCNYSTNFRKYILLHLKSTCNVFRSIQENSSKLKTTDETPVQKQYQCSNCKYGTSNRKNIIHHFKSSCKVFKSVHFKNDCKVNGKKVGITSTFNKLYSCKYNAGNYKNGCDDHKNGFKKYSKLKINKTAQNVFEKSSSAETIQENTEEKPLIGSMEVKNEEIEEDIEMKVKEESIREKSSSEGKNHEKRRRTYELNSKTIELSKLLVEKKTFQCQDCSNYSTNIKKNFQVHAQKCTENRPILKESGIATFQENTAEKHLIERFDVKNKSEIREDIEMKTKEEIEIHTKAISTEKSQEKRKRMIKLKPKAKESQKLPVNKKLLQCQYCTIYNTNIKKHFQVHVQKCRDARLILNETDNSVELHSCEYCNYRTSSRQCLVYHRMKEHPRNITTYNYNCYHCSYSTNKLETFIKHIYYWCVNYIKYVKMLNEPDPNKKELAKQDYDYICHHCKYKTFLKQYFLKHLLKCRKFGIFKTNSRAKYLRWKRRIKAKNKQKNFQNYLKRKELGYVKYLKRFGYNYVGDYSREYICLYCTNYKSSSIEQLRTHSRSCKLVNIVSADVNRNATEYDDVVCEQCYICKCRIQNMNHYVEHMKKHQDELIYSKSNFDLNNIKYSCDICNNSVNQDMTHHMFMNHRHIFYFKCDFCQFASMSCLILNHHMCYIHEPSPGLVYIPVFQIS